MTAVMGHKVGFLYVERGRFLSKPVFSWWKENDVQCGLLRSWYFPKVATLTGMWERCYRNLYNKYVAEYGIPDLIHAHGYVAGMAARALSHRTHIPYLVTEHNTSIPAGIVRWYHAPEMRRAYRDAAALIAVSSFLNQAMLRWTLRSDIHVIYNPVDFHKFTMHGHKSDHTHLQLISIGALDPRKNQGLLLDALSRLDKSLDIRLDVIGSGPQQAFLERKATDLGLRVQWLGELSPTEVSLQLASADVFISTSNLETFGVAIVEALACGVPVISTDSGAPREYIHDRVGIVIPAKDPATVVEAIEYIFQHRGKYDANFIREYARGHFDFPVIGSQVNQVYDEILKST